MMGASVNKTEQTMTILTVPRDEASQKLNDRVKRGKEIRNLPIQTENDLKNAKNEKQKWSTYNLTLLKTIFSDDTFAEQYSPSKTASVSRINASLDYYIDEFREDIGRFIARLESVSDQLELIPESSNSNTRVSRSSNITSRQVFIVHGHDEAARESLARFLEKLGLDAIILHERPNAGRTIIEKFEQEAATIGFAIVLLTPDDLGTSADKPDNLQPRARQNAILELGYFIGRLGRERVCAFHKDELEIPSDIAGVAYVAMDSRGNWRIELARELKTAGFDVDLNKAL